MAVIYLIRHGQASFGQDDYDCLSEQGTLQATHLGNSLAKRQITFDKVIIGGMLRHRQTADNLCGLPLVNNKNNNTKK
jgi:broad specificity phosphatase PhoE